MTCVEFYPALDALLNASGIRHFRAYELCPVGKRAGVVELRAPPERLWPNIVPTLRVLDALRESLGKPIHVLSGYRDPDYNRAVGGESASLHLEFNAIDFRVRGMAPVELAGWLNARPGSQKYGIGCYQTFTHFDTRAVLGRAAPARWSGDGVGRWW